MKHLKFAQNLKRALAENNMTQVELADLMHTTQATVSRWIGGINQPDYESLIEICLYLDETPNALLGFDDISPNVIETFKDKKKF